MTNQSSFASLFDARNRCHAEAAPLSTGATPGEKADFPLSQQAEGAPMPRVFPPRECKSVVADAVRQAAPVEFKLSQVSAGEVTGYGSIFGNVDAYGDVVEKGAFAASLVKHRADSTAPAMLWSHDPERPIGVWDTFEEDGKGLKLTGRLNLDTQDGREARALLMQGAVSGLSIGYQVDRGGAALGKDGIRRLTALKLWEVSLVTFPANTAARISGVKSMGTRSAFEDFLRDAGFAKAAARLLAGGGWPALQKENPVADLIAAVRSATNELKSKG